MIIFFTSFFVSVVVQLDESISVAYYDMSCEIHDFIIECVYGTLSVIVLVSLAIPPPSIGLGVIVIKSPN